MNISSIINFVAEIVEVLTNWLNNDQKEWAWCPVRVDNRSDRY